MTLGRPLDSTGMALPQLGPHLGMTLVGPMTLLTPVTPGRPSGEIHTGFLNSEPLTAPSRYLLYWLGQAFKVWALLADPNAFGPRVRYIEGISSFDAPVFRINEGEIPDLFYLVIYSIINRNICGRHDILMEAWSE